MDGLAALLKKDWRSARNVRRIMKEQSVFKVTFILSFALGMIAGLWALFLEGFHFMDTLDGVGLMLVSRLFALFFFGLAAMLALSSAVTSFTTFFRSDETAYLLLKPLSMGQITLYKFLQSAVFASWAFFFTIIPFVGAYAWHERLPVLFSAWTFVFSIPLVLLCSGLGTLACLVWARWFPRGRIVGWGALVLVPLIWWWGSRTVGSSLGGGDESALLLTRLVPGMRIASNPLWPSWWVSEGIMAITRGQWFRGLMLWGVLVANLLLLTVIVQSAGEKLFYGGWQRTQYAGGLARRKGVLLRPVERALRFLASDLRGLIMKDIRVFLRDPAQWSQGLVFFGLLGLYFINLRTLRYHMLPPEWRNLIAFLNVFSVSSVMCSFGARFVYPQPSLEGHGFWIVGLSPTTMGRVLLAKFAVAVTGLMAVSVGLMYVSTRMLVVPAAVQAVAIGIAVAMSLGVSGLSTGLGALFIDLKQQNPAAIVSGFGGTLNLVLSLAFIFGVIVPFGVIFHLHFLGHMPLPEMHRWLALGSVWLVLVTAITTLVPLVLGSRSLRQREY